MRKPSFISSPVVATAQRTYESEGWTATRLLCQDGWVFEKINDGPAVALRRLRFPFDPDSWTWEKEQAGWMVAVVR